MTSLHHLAQAEAEKKISADDIATQTEILLRNGADVHQVDRDGNTAFNIAAPASPLIGRLMTNHWLSLALIGKGAKGLNDRSGSHNSTLAQYIAKWSNAKEIDEQLHQAIAAGMDIAVPNASGWTPLHAAAAMIGRWHAVQAFARVYTVEQLSLRTTEEYETRYLESLELIHYGVGLTAAGVAQARLDQAKTLPKGMKEQLTKYVSCIIKKE